MWDSICEDILLEILIRLPNCKKATQVSTVCKTWLAVIRSPDIRKRFNEEKNKNINNKCFKFTHVLASKLLPPQNFDFIPWESPKVLACGGGLLVLYFTNTNQNNYNICVCNPMTKEWSLLPRIPAPNYYNWRLGIACSTPDNSSFKLVNVRSIRKEGMTIPDGRIEIDIFCSESKSWSESSVALASASAKSIPQLSSGVQSGTRLYWMNGNDSNCTGILALDPFLGLAELVKLPAGCQGKLKTMKLSSVLGRLRLSQLYWKERVNGYSFKIWELSDSDGVWRLVRRARPDLERYYGQVAGLHPNDGDKVYLKCHGERDLRLYDIASGTFRILGRFPYPHWTGNYTVIHPCAFPCPIPDFTGTERKRKNTQPAPITQLAPSRRQKRSTSKPGWMKDYLC